jgi:hypothetical protein
MIGGYWYATSVEAYALAEHVIENDPAILEHMGKPKTHRLTFLNGYHISTFGTSEKAEYRFKVASDAAEGVVDLALERSIGRWRLVEGTLRIKGGALIALEPRELR